jgi:hypothetical protein
MTEGTARMTSGQCGHPKVVPSGYPHANYGKLAVRERGARGGSGRNMLVRAA